MKVIFLSLVGILILSFSGCSNTTNSTEQNPSGIWIGTQSIHSESGAGVFDMRTLVHDGKFFGISQDAEVIYAGTYDIKEGEYLSANSVEDDNTSYTLYDLKSGKKVSDGSIGFKIEERNSLVGNFENTLNQFGEIQANYSPLYEIGSSLELVSTSYQTEDVNLTIEANSGEFTGLLYSCSINGNISILDSNKNIYDVHYTLSDCNNSGSYSGVGIVAYNSDENLSYFTAYAENKQRSHMEVFSYYLIDSVKTVGSSNASETRGKPKSRNALFLTNQFKYVTEVGSDFSDIEFTVVDEKEVCGYVGGFFMGPPFYSCRNEKSVRNASFSDSDFSNSDFSRSKLKKATFKNSNFNNVNFSNATLAGATFSNTTIESADFSNSDLSGANLSSTDISGVSFSTATIKGIKLSGLDLSNRDFSGKDLTGADFSDTNVEGVDFTGAILTKIKLKNADLSYRDFSGADLSGADLSSANLTGVTLSKTLLKGAKLKKVVLTGVDLSGRDLSSIDLSNSNLSSANLSNTNLTKANFYKADLSGADLSGVKISKRFFLEGYYSSQSASATYTNFSSADLSNTNMSNTNFVKGYFKGANLAGANFSSSDLSESELSSTNLAGADFSNANLSGATLKDITSIEGADFSGTDLSNVQFDKKTLALFIAQGHFSDHYADLKLSGDLREFQFASNYFENVVFENATLSNIDFTEAHFNNVTLKKSSLENMNLKKATFTNSTIVADFSDINAEGVDFSGTEFVSVVRGPYDDIDVTWNNTNLRNSNLSTATYNGKTFNSLELFAVHMLADDLDLSGAWLEDRRCGPASYSGICTPTITFGYSYDDYRNGKDEIDYFVDKAKEEAKELANKGKEWVENKAEEAVDEVKKYVPKPFKSLW